MGGAPSSEDNVGGEGCLSCKDDKMSKVLPSNGYGDGSGVFPPFLNGSSCCSCECISEE